MTSTGLLIVTNPGKFARILPTIQQQYVHKTLYVQYYPGRCKLLVPNPGKELVSKPVPVGVCHGKNIIRMYTQANDLCENLDVRILLREIKCPSPLPMIQTHKKIEVVIFDHSFSSDEVSDFLQNCLGNVSQSCQSVTLNDNEELKAEDLSMQYGSTKTSVSQENEEKVYENVVLGGTFDRLHAGHKAMLSEAVLRCTSKLTVGVTDIPMLKSKTLWELIQPCSERMKSVQEFLQDIDAKITYNIVPIVDPFGPTKEDPSFQMIVVSAETAKGGHAVNELRAKNGLSKLDVVIVDLLSSDLSGVKRLPEENEEEKVSSSNQRLRLLGTRLKMPVSKPGLPDRPYIIGLTGGIASGKTRAGERMAELGAGVIVCDTLAHDLYRPGQPLYSRIVKEFGQNVVTGEGGEIDRKVLGAIVFKDKDKLARLNALVWPVLMDRVQIEAQKLYQSGFSVVVIEAAVLIQAGWMDRCHEIWTCIIPEAEAIKRLVERNGLSEEEARKRVAAQPSNSEQIAAANVVISPLWSPEYTRRQIVRAWTELQDSFKDSKL